MALPNILLVILDSVRASNCSLHGHDNETTPWLSTFANEVTVFEQARAPSIHSIASHASIFSGYHTDQHRLSEHESYLDPVESIWHELRDEHDYETGLFTPNVVITEASNLNEPFEICSGPKRDMRSVLYEDAFSPTDIDGGIPDFLSAAVKSNAPIKSLLNGVYFRFFAADGVHDPERESAEVYVDEFVDWAEARSGPWAACLNLMDAHYPYHPAPKHNLWGGGVLTNVRDEMPREPMSKQFLKGRPWGQLRALESLYDGCIHQLDRSLERLVNRLTDIGMLDDTLLIVTSDHGEGFGERSHLTPSVRMVDHSWGIHERLTHVPLVVSTPGEGSGQRIEQPASLTRFPEVVRTAIDGDDAAEVFIPDEELVLTSTFRVLPPGDELPISESEREPYFGPWRAAYQEENGAVLKYATRGEDTIVERCIDAQTSCVDNDRDNAGEQVLSVYDSLPSVDVSLGEASSREVETDVEDRLANLGYLR